MNTLIVYGILALSLVVILFLVRLLKESKTKFHQLSLQIAQVVEQSKGSDSIGVIDLAPWIEASCKESCELWGRAFLNNAYANLAKFLPSMSVLFFIESSNEDEKFPDFVAGNIEPVLELILCELLCKDRKAMRLAPVELARFGVADHQTHIFEIISGLTLTVWAGSKRKLDSETWDQVCRYFAEVQRLLAILILKRRAKDSSNRKESQLMLSQVTHDIRSPLNNVKNAIIFASDMQNEDISDYLNVALKNLESVSELTETILDYSSVSSGVLQSKQESVNITQILNDISDRFSVSAQVKGIKILVNSNTTKIGLFDKKQLDRVISNLVSNAIKYSSSGIIEISSTDYENDKIQISISDQGIGLTTEQISKLFTPFTRFQRHLAPGAGLGLSFVKQLIELNNSSILVESTFGKGTIFSIQIPIAIGVIADKSESTISNSKSNHKILIIDDDVDIRWSMQRSLEAEGIEVLTAHNFIEAQSICSMEFVDAIISDLETGAGSLEEFISTQQYLRIKPPILVVTGSNLTVIPSGVHSVVRKPVDTKELVIWVKNQPVQQDNSVNKVRELLAAN